MKPSIFTGRYTSCQEDDVVVFIIGMRVNKRWAVHKWLPVFAAMPTMIRELSIQKEHGCLSMESFFGLRTTLMVQYWRSTEDLMAYARGPKHASAWKRFNQKARNNDAVGIYHETYNVPKGSYESIYANMPQYGLAKAIGHHPITPSLHTARQNLDTHKTY
ncbi:DUF4188 domain-containing protein [Thalassobacillus sp. CUG 92003]|uniref:DUF4188 domain-containing protein n=1 Tax=Thalassobacillus sp. CUG 92003 TaxID=2736641 RepID=UPI0015E6EDAD|nr:DUF4188 domain-containing protein [Thalassobacillus sp. CUG 92003]